MLKKHPWVSFCSSLMLKALLWSVFGHVRIGIKLQRRNTADGRWGEKKPQMVKYVVEQKYCSFSLLRKEKAELFWFDFLPDARLVSPLLCSDCMWILEIGRVCAVYMLLCYWLYETCVWVCVWVCCSDWTVVCLQWLHLMAICSE